MQESGAVRVQAVASRAQLPVAGATVTVSLTDATGRWALLSLQRTDESGFTREIRVDTPPLVNSLSPDLAQGWTPVRIAVSHPNYDGVIVNTVQIFPGITTVLQAVLIPRGGIPGDLGETEEITVPPQDL